MSQNSHKATESHITKKANFGLYVIGKKANNEPVLVSPSPSKIFCGYVKITSNVLLNMSKW